MIANLLRHSFRLTTTLPRRRLPQSLDWQHRPPLLLHLRLPLPTPYSTTSPPSATKERKHGDIEPYVTDPTRFKRWVQLDPSKKGQWRPKCERSQCMIAPRYAAEGDTVRRRCKHHKLPGDVVVGNVGKICQHEGCGKRASYGDASKQGHFAQHELLKWCNDHKDPDRDINLTVNHCLEPGCTLQASFGSIEDGVPKWCKNHAKKSD